MEKTGLRLVGLFVGSIAVGLALAAAPVQANLILNNSFEANTNAWPGAGSITSWTVSSTARDGINPASNGSSPFADNGVIPDGSRVAFIQYSYGGTANNNISQTVSGLTPGAQYSLSLYYNARYQNGNGGYTGISVSVDGGTTTLWSNPVVASVTGSNAYNYEETTFTAADTFATLVITNTSTSSTRQVGGGNNYDGNTLLVDNVQMNAVVPEPGTLALLAFGSMAVMSIRRKTKKSA